MRIRILDIGLRLYSVVFCLFDEWFLRGNQGFDVVEHCGQLRDGLFDAAQLDVALAHLTECGLGEAAAVLELFC